MICRNCSFILQGSEKFCPNCGADCSLKQKTEKTEELQPPVPPSIFFTSPNQSQQNNSDHRIFSEDDEEREEIKKAKKSRAKPVLIALLSAVILLVGGFTAMEYFNLAPVIVNYLETGLTQPQSESDKTISSDKVDSEFPSDKGIIPPDISYKPAICYVMSYSSLPLRKGPDEGYAPVVYISSGSQVQVIGSSSAYDSWVYAFFPTEEKYGWISASFLCDTELPEAEIEENTDVSESEVKSE
ncbi:MAG: SH3 domain-containing protein [Acutalibacteraceae bacterium]|nr:SH3 domain-containing protein [Acutalibacteraceae bacterium]